MSEPDTTPATTPIVDDQEGLLDRLVGAVSPIAMRAARVTDRVDFEAGLGPTVAKAEELDAQWEAQGIALAEEERRGAEAIRMSDDYTERAVQRLLEVHAKESAEKRAKVLDPIAAAVTDVLARCEAADQATVLGPVSSSDGRTPEQVRLDTIAEKLDLLALALGAQGRTDKELADWLAPRIERGDPATSVLLALADLRMVREPEQAKVLRLTARAAQHTRAKAALESDPKRASALSRLALVRMTRQRVENKRAFYQANPHGVMPVVTSNSRG